jgi:hypothetical protein
MSVEECGRGIVEWNRGCCMPVIQIKDCGKVSANIWAKSDFQHSAEPLIPLSPEAYRIMTLNELYMTRCVCTLD